MRRCVRIAETRCEGVQMGKRTLSDGCDHSDVGRMEIATRNEITKLHSKKVHLSALPDNKKTVFLQKECLK